MENIEFKHSIKVQIRFNDIDIMGHVNNAIHQYYYDFARVDYFEKVFENTVDWDDESLLIAHIEIDYFQPIRLEDKIAVKTKICKLGNKSLQMVQEVYSTKSGIIHSKSKSVLVGYSKLKSTSIQIPKRWREKIRKYEGI